MAERSFPRIEDFDPRRIDLSSLPLPAPVRDYLQSLQDLSDEELKEKLKDALYTAVGLAVLTFQRAQVLRREATEKLEERAPQCAEDVNAAIQSVITKLREFVPAAPRAETKES
jgi:hypothetical protein